MQEDVVFKGSKGGLELVLNNSADFADILEQLKDKLESAAHFFTGGAQVIIPPGVNALSSDERRQLINLLADYGLALSELPNRESGVCVGRESVPDKLYDIPVEYCQEASGGQKLIVSRMLRGGQKLIFAGSVVIMGDINPGAEVIAGGDIVVHGTCRGVAHAGAYGNQAATITADRLVAAQLRIAGLIARAPDNQDEPNYREKARIAGGVVIIEPAS